ncbi:MAG: Secretion system C-terminal sorting domain [Patescibacteria group bacterium]|nr:Secretion system C-terminal sorting domain [Patescibacteria group bacterium]
MKNLTLFIVVTLSLFGVTANAQSYDVRWSDRIGPNNVTFVADYADFDEPVYRRVYRNNSTQYYSPIWAPLEEEVLSGDGVDVISLNYGGDLLIQILNQNFEVIESLTHRQTVSTLPEPVMTVYDVIYGQPPLIRFRADINSPYGLGRPSYYVTTLKCHIVRTFPSFWEQIVEWTFPIGIVPFAEFNLPFDFFGDYCVTWSITDEDTSLDSHFGETIVWQSEALCFSYGSTGFHSDYLKSETVLLSYPNPFVDIVTVTSPSTTAYEVTNLNGQKVASGWLMLGDNRLDVLSGLPSGMYILQTEIGTTKLIKQ